MKNIFLVDHDANDRYFFADALKEVSLQTDYYVRKPREFDKLKKVIFKPLHLHHKAN